MPPQKGPTVSETIDFAKEEEVILKLWKDKDVFKTYSKLSKTKPRFLLFDGPPFAIDLPNYGDILAATVKDVVSRYAHQQGFHVEAKFGWDCHGLPIEYQVDKALNIKEPNDVRVLGLHNYNAECRRVATKCSKDWENILERLGRWTDFRKNYKTMDLPFMESIWVGFKYLYLENFVYHGRKVVPYSTTFATPLPHFEIIHNYKEVVDPSIVVSFPIVDHTYGASILIWTTAPWTLPSNLACCIHPNLQYVFLLQKSSKKQYVILKSRINSVFKTDDYIIIEHFRGRKLKGMSYKPPYTYFHHLKDRAFKIVTDESVTETSGTGIVHLAPYFDEDDFRIALNAGIITENSAIVCPVDSSGRFVRPITRYEGMYIKDADEKIVEDLEVKGRLVHQTQIKHSVPFCWRSNIPVIHLTFPAWFIKSDLLKKRLEGASVDTKWVPNFVKEQHFDKWLQDGKDWAISRNRYWGTPIPIWTNGQEVRCVGSIAELEELTGRKVADLHRESVDHLEIPSRIPGNPPLRRVKEVFDCWFESGSMPHAQRHFPFENVDDFKKHYPADFVAESIDQTKGWFYALVVASAALFDETPPFKNLIACGRVLSNGEVNSSACMNVIAKYGADALRLYLISSPAVCAEDLNFQEEEVCDVLKNVLVPLRATSRFLLENIEKHIKKSNLEFCYVEGSFTATKEMDRWILSTTQSLLIYVRKEMDLYHLCNVAPRIIKHIYQLTNWYVPLNKTRLEGDKGTEDCKSALLTLFQVLLDVIKVMSPYTPFLSEQMYQDLKRFLKHSFDSVHYFMYPKMTENLTSEDMERAVLRMQKIIKLGRLARERKSIDVKYSVRAVTVVHEDPQYLADILSLANYILSELDARTIKTTRDLMKFGVTFRAEPNYKVLDSRPQENFNTAAAKIEALTDTEIKKMIKVGYVIFVGKVIDISQIRLFAKAGSVINSQYDVIRENDVIILLNTIPDVNKEKEGTG